MATNDKTAKAPAVETKLVSGKVPADLLMKAEDIAFSEGRVRKTADLLRIVLGEYVSKRESA